MDKFEFKSMLIAHSAGIYFLLGVMSFLFANIEYNYIILPIVYVVLSINLNFGINQNSEIIIIPHHIMFYIVVTIFYVYYLGIMMPDFLNIIS